jgi:4-hydroxybenzoate polyprenyltransferase
MLFTKLRELLGLVKFSHTLFALPFALLGAALAARGPDGWHGRWRDWLGILLCMATARSAAMAFNRLVDRRIDALNPRTAMRHLPSGQLSVGTVAAFTAINGVAFVAATLLFWPNRWPLYLSGPVLLWLLGYSYTKRFTSLAHAWLGASLALAPLAAWIALRGDLAWPPALLGLAVLFWVTGFDVIYACQDVEFDRATGLHSFPARFGIAAALRAARVCHGLTIAAFAALGWMVGLGAAYWVGVLAVTALFVYEHSLVSPTDLSRLDVAFFNVNGYIAVILFVAVLAGRLA